MDKYIVKLEETKNRFTGKKSYRIVGTNTYISAEDVMCMKKYVAPAPMSEVETGAFGIGYERGKKLGYKNGFKDGSEEAWNIASLIVSLESKGGMPEELFNDIFHDAHCIPEELFCRVSFEKVKQRLKKRKVLPK